ncbi:MAG: oxidoreductase, partial [bacterium]
MGKVMVIDLSICNGCHNCQVACKDEHVGNDWSPIARPQPDTGQFWN